MSSRSRGRRLGLLLALGVVALATPPALLQFDGVGTAVFRWAASRMAPDGIRVGVDRVSGSWVGGVRLSGLEVEDLEAGHRVSADTVAVVWRVLRWRWGRITMEAVEVAGGEGRWVRALEGEVGGDPDTEGDLARPPGGWGLTVGRIEVRRSSASMVSPGGRFEISGLEGRLDSLRVASGGVSLAGWDVRAGFRPSGKPADWGRVVASGGWSGDRLRVDTLDVVSPRSRVVGSASIPLDGSVARPGSLRWDLRAAPLALADLQGLVEVPAVVEGDSLFVRSGADAVTEGARLVVEGRTSAGTVVEMAVLWSVSGDEWRGETDLRIDDLDPARYGLSGVAGAVSGAFEGRVGMRRTDGRTVALEGEGAVAMGGPGIRVLGSVRASRRPGAEGGVVDSIRLALDTLRWKEVDLRSATFRAWGDGNRPGWALDARTATGGRVSGQGTGPTGPDPDWAGRLAFADVVLAEARVSGTLSVDASGVDPAEARAVLALELRSSSLAEWPVDSARVAVDWEAGSGAVRGEVRGPRGGLRAAGRVDVDSRGGEVVVDSLLFSDLLLAVPPPAAGTAGAADPHDAARVTGRLRGVGAWRGAPGAPPDPERVTGVFDVEVDPFVAAGAAVDGVVGRGEYREGTVSADLAVELPGGGRLAGRVEGRTLDSLDLGVRGGTFAALDLSALGGDLPRTGLVGQWEGELQGGGEVEAFRWSFESELDEGTVAGRPLTGGHLALIGVGRSGEGEFRLDLAGGQVRGRLEADDEGEGPGWGVEAEASLPRLGGWVGRPDDSVAVVGRMALRAPAGGAPRRLDLRISRAVGFGATVDSAVVSAELGSGRLVLDTVLVRSDVVRVDGGGSLPTGRAVDGRREPAGSFRLDAVVVEDPAVLSGPGGEALILSEGRLRLSSACGGGACGLEGDLELGSTLLGRNAVSGVGIAFTGTMGPDGDPRSVRVDGRGRVDELRTPSARVRRLGSEFRTEEGRLVLDASADVDDGREASVRAVLDSDDGHPRVLLQEARFRRDDARWALVRPSTIRFLRPGVVVDTVAFRAAEKDLLVRGSWTPEVRDFEVRADSFPVGAFADFLGWTGLDGRLDAVVRAQGTGTDLVVDARVSGGLTRDGEALHDVRLLARGEGGLVQVDAVLADAMGRPRLRLQGGVPAADSGPGWDLRLVADTLPLDWLEPYLPSEVVDGLDGVALGDLRLTGPRTAPEIDGALRIQGARASLPGLGTTWSDVGVHLVASGHEVEVDSLSVRSGGEATGVGRVGLSSWSEPPTLDGRITVRDFVVADRPELGARVDATLTLVGTSRRPRIDGDVAVLEADVRPDGTVGGGAVEEVELTREDWAVLQRRFGIVPPRERDLGALLPEDGELDLRVTLGRDIWVRQEVNPEMALQLTGEVRVRKSLGEEQPDLEGRIETISERSYVEQFGRRFEVEEGTVQLRGAPEEATVDLAAAYRPPARSDDAAEVVIRMGISGRVGDLDLDLSSEPAMDNSDIISYLATGRPASTAFASDGAGSSVAGIGTDLLASELTNAIERFARNDVGLDVVEIRSDGVRGATLVAGQYVTPKIFIGLSQPVSFNGGEGERTPQAEAEWRALRWLLVNLQTGGAAFRFFLDGSIGY